MMNLLDEHWHSCVPSYIGMNSDGKEREEMNSFKKVSMEERAIFSIKTSQINIEAAFCRRPLLTRSPTHKCVSH